MSKKMPWFRFYCDAVHHPKVMGLPLKLRWFWVELLALACQSDDGSLPELRQISVLFKTRSGRLGQQIDELLAAGLLDRDSENRLFPHNWGQRQYKSDTSTERVKRFRNGDETADETVLKRPQRQRHSTEREEKERKQAKERKSPPPKANPEHVAAIYAAYPRKVAKADAVKAIGKALLTVPYDTLLTAVQRFAGSVAGEDLKFIPYPATWFNGSRWLDDPVSQSVPASNGSAATTVQQGGGTPKETRTAWKTPLPTDDLGGRPWGWWQQYLGPVRMDIYLTKPSEVRPTRDVWRLLGYEEIHGPWPFENWDQQVADYQAQIAAEEIARQREADLEAERRSHEPLPF